MGDVKWVGSKEFDALEKEIWYLYSEAIIDEKEASRRLKAALKLLTPAQQALIKEYLLEGGVDIDTDIE